MNKLVFAILVGLGLSVWLISAFSVLRPIKSTKKLPFTALKAEDEKVAVIIIDHGSKRLEANQSLDLVNAI